MQSRRPDPSFIAPAAGVQLSANPVDVVVLTTDAALLDTLQQAVNSEHALWHAQSADATVELLVGGHSGILIADLQVLRTDAARLLERLQAQFPELVLLATGRREEEHSVAALVGSGKVYRFLHKPVSPARASNFISAATRRYMENSASTTPRFDAVKEFARPTSRSGSIIAAIVAVGVLSLVWMYWPRAPKTEAPQEAAVARQPAAPAPKATVTPNATVIPDRLSAADRAFTAGRLSSPPRDNALELYRAVLAVDANNKEALAGVARVLANLDAQVTEALAAHDLPKAATALTTLQRAEPNSPRVDELRTELLSLSRSARPEVAPAPVKTQPTPPPRAEPPAATKPAAAPQAQTSAKPAPAPRAANQGGPNLAAARARIADGQLADPANDSAVYFVRRAVAAGENESAISIVATDLGTRMLEQVRQAISTGNAEDAQRALAAVSNVDREFSLGLPELDAVRQQVSGMIASNRKAAIADQLARAVKLRESGRLIAPPGDNAYEKLSALVASDPNMPEVRTEQQRLAFTLLESTRTAIAAGDIDTAEALAKRADTLVPEMTNTRALLQQIATTKKQRDLANTPVSAATIKRTREVATVYPRDAQRDGVEGWVDIDFTIATDGSTRDLIVRNAQPKDIFDKAALDALSKWRFEPVVREGAPVAQRATVRMRFSLKG